MGDDETTKEVVISGKVFFSIIAFIIIALIGVVLNPLFGAYGIIIGAFLTWVMASYLYVIYGSNMLDTVKLKVLLFTPTIIYVALVIIFFSRSETIMQAISQILGSASMAVILYLFLYILMEYYKAKGTI